MNPLKIFPFVLGSSTVPECAVCLQPCIHPARLPCSHIFCYLCVKGVANQSKRCPMCRQEIPADFLERPQLVEVDEPQKETAEVEDEYHWFYEGRNGNISILFKTIFFSLKPHKTYQERLL